MKMRDINRNDIYESLWISSITLKHTLELLEVCLEQWDVHYFPTQKIMWRTGSEHSSNQ